VEWWYDRKGLILVGVVSDGWDMKPRNLRHRLEKTARLLVTVQKYLPEVDCRFDDLQGDHGCLMVRLPRGGNPVELGKDLEGKGMRFTRVHKPWLGVITYRGVKEDQPHVIIEVETVADRLYRGNENKPEPWSFRTNGAG
jgi:hypothetical protein